MVLGNLLGGFITILVGVNLIPAVADGVFDARWNNGSAERVATNVTGAASTIIDLSTLFFALGIMASGVGLATAGLREAGIL